MVRSSIVLTGIVCTLSAPAAAESLSENGRGLFLAHCAVCHEQEAQGGEVPVARGGVSPPDLTKIADRRGSVWPMLEVMSIIDGYTKATQSRDGMPVIETLNQGPQIDFDTGNGNKISTPARLVALTYYLESIQSPKPESYVP